MRSVGIKTLKNKLSEYIRLAASGEIILVTDRDRVVAELVAPRVERSPMLADALLAEAVRKGWIAPAVLPPSGPPARSPVAPLSEILTELELDREDR
jgi:antitoxin (DNA-binding transcriptional repressor) of toxin-antitoxin stability system